MKTIFKVFWHNLTWVMNPGFTDCEADALTTTPSCRCDLDHVGVGGAEKIIECH